jgi:hypothetical protein
LRLGFADSFSGDNSTDTSGSLLFELEFDSELDSLLEFGVLSHKFFDSRGVVGGVVEDPVDSSDEELSFLDFFSI